MVRENVDTSLPTIVVLLDNRRTAHPDRAGGTADSFEAGCEAAASVVVAALREDLPVTLLTVVPEDDPDAPPLDRLTVVGLADGALSDATARLRQQRAGDTLVFLTGPGGQAELGHVGALRGGYPSVVVGVFGAAERTPPGTAGLVVVDAADGAAFAAEWDRVRRW
jgi:hypothetical protein